LAVLFLSMMRTPRRFQRHEEKRSMDITPATIRDASFALMPMGCNPVQVEEALAAIAEHVTQGKPVGAELLQAEFDTVSAGFSSDEVAAFFAALRKALLEPSESSSPDSTDEAGSTVPTEPSEPVSGPGSEVVSEQSASPAAAIEATEEHGSAAVGVTTTRTAGSAIGSSLPTAVERTKLAVSELETFVIHQMEEAKAALRLHIDQTQTDCQNTLETARTVSDQALDTARQRAEVLLDVATRTTAQLRDRFDSELAAMRAAFEDELGRRHAAIQADLEALVAEAQTLTQEAHGQIREVHDDVRASLEDARTVLTTPAARLAA
jgi:hypothetical protein